MMAHAVLFACPASLSRRAMTASTSSPRTNRLMSSTHVSSWGLEVVSRIPRNQRTNFQVKASAGAGPEVEVVRDEEWEKIMHEQTDRREAERRSEKDEEFSKGTPYRNFTQQLKAFPEEEVRHAKKFVASLIKAGEAVEEMIEEAADNGELTPVVLLVIKNRLHLARHDDERYAIQALDLLYRRVEAEMCKREASPALQLLNELLNLNDGFGREEWLRQCRRVMVQIFPPEDALSILGGSGFDLSKQHGPIGMPEEEDDILLRIDFIREVNEFLAELKAQPELEPLQGLDPPSVGIRLRQEDRIRAVGQVKDLLNLAVKLKW